MSAKYCLSKKNIVKNKLTKKPKPNLQMSSSLLFLPNIYYDYYTGIFSNNYSAAYYLASHMYMGRGKEKLVAKITTKIWEQQILFNR